MDLSEYTIQGSQDAARALAKNNLRWIALRWYYMILLAVIAMTASFLSTLSLTKVYEYGLILAAGYVVNITLLLLVQSAKDRLWVQRFALSMQLFLDLFMCAVVVYVQGGIEARTTMLFAIPIISSGLAFMRKLVIPVAAVSGLVYIAAVLAHGYFANGSIDWTLYAVPLAFYPLVFLVIGRAVEFLTTLEVNDMRERTYNSFLSLLAHQLKHPASASKAIIDVIQHDDSANHTEQTQHYLQLLRGESENQIRLIDNLLEAAPRNKLDVHIEPVNIVLLLEKAAHQAARGHQRLGDLIRDHSTGGAVTVQGSPIKLQLALTNIFDNSFRHTDDGTAVSYGVTVNAGTVEIVVSDAGAGIPKDRLIALNQRFSAGNIHSLDARHVGGLGLGLYVAQQIVTAHGGTLAVQSKEGHGTTVTIRMKGTKA